MNILTVFEGDQPRFKNQLLEDHSQHFINAGISTFVLWQLGMISNDQLTRTYFSAVTVDFLIKHHRQIIKQFAPDLFIL